MVPKESAEALTALTGANSSRGEERKSSGVSILVPVFNEAAAVADTVDQVLEAAARLDVEFELILIDDGSTDGTQELISQFESRAQVIRHRNNRGYGAALKSGMSAARGDWIVIIDADGTYPVDRLDDLWSKCDVTVDMVVGARTAVDAKVPFVRRPAKWALALFASWLAGHSIPDLNSGFRIFRRSVAWKSLPLLPDGFSFTSTITLAFLSENRPIEYVPIAYHRRRGHSKIRPFHDTYQFFLLVLRTSLLFAPLRFFFPLGASFMALSLLFVGYRALIGQAFGVISVILFVTGIQLLALGLLADLVNRKIEGVRGGI